MFKLAIVGTIAAVAFAHEDHPINREIIEEIKAKTSLWTPHEYENNPLRHKSIEEIHSMLGLNIEYTQTFLPID